jgi:hypothetical protein
MTKEQALKDINEMSEYKFQKFFKQLPPRVQLIVRSGFVEWREVLSEWYIKLSNEKTKNDH